MIGLNPKQKVLVVSLFVIGGVILSNGSLKISLAGADIVSDGFVLHKIISELVQGRSITHTTIAQTTVDPVRHVEASNDWPINYKNGTVTGNIHTIIKLYTREAWAAENEIRYDITSTITGTDKVRDIFFFTTGNATHSIEDILETGYNEFKEEYYDEGIISLIKEEPTRWSKQGNFTVPLRMELAFAGGYVIEDKAYPRGTEPLVEIESASVKIQADASRALIQQVNESKKTNHIIEGLTWILISVIPIGFGFEIILREYYHNKKKPRTHMEFLR